MHLFYSAKRALLANLKHVSLNTQFSSRSQHARKKKASPIPDGEIQENLFKQIKVLFITIRQNN
jgi:hypothetical protein